MSSQAEADAKSVQLTNYQKFNRLFAFSRNAGAYKIATEMRNLGHNVEVLDFITYWPEESIKKFLDERIPYVDVLGWSSQFFFNFTFYKKWCDYIRSINPKIIFIAGGPKVTNLLNFNQSRYLIAGYAEDAIVDVLNHIEGKPNQLKFKLVNNAYYVDCLEFYKMVTLPNMQTVYHPSDCVGSDEVLTVGTGRGCVFKCSFCTYPYIGKNKKDFNRQNSESYYREFMHNYDRWGTTNYYFSDETANDNVEKLKDIEEAAERLPFNLDFTGFTRLDLLDKQRASWSLFKNIGFTNWHFGIETFNPQSLKAMSKGYDPKKLQQVLFDIKEYFGDESLVYASFIVGAPYETPETFQTLTLDWINGEGKNLLDGKVMFPLNIHRESQYAIGSEFSKDYKKYGYTDMTQEEIEKEMSLDPTITAEVVAETAKYNILWSTPHWNALSIERYAKQYSQGSGWETNISCWTRARALSTGIPKEQIKSLCRPNNHPFHVLFESNIEKCLDNYIQKKLSTNYFLTKTIVDATIAT
jgi:radical SAM superfamily enzyme YgiQ (UPF0313 family)